MMLGEKPDSPEAERTRGSYTSVLPNQRFEEGKRGRSWDNFRGKRGDPAIAKERSSEGPYALKKGEKEKVN